LVESNADQVFSSQRLYVQQPRLDQDQQDQPQDEWIRYGSFDLAASSSPLPSQSVDTNQPTVSSSSSPSIPPPPANLLKDTSLGSPFSDETPVNYTYYSQPQAPSPATTAPNGSYHYSASPDQAWSAAPTLPPPPSAASGGGVSELLPSGSRELTDGCIAYPDGWVRLVDGSFRQPNGKISLQPALALDQARPASPQHGDLQADGTIRLPNGTYRLPSGAITTADGHLSTPDGQLIKPLWELP